MYAIRSYYESNLWPHKDQERFRLLLAPDLPEVLLAKFFEPRRNRQQREL